MLEDLDMKEWNNAFQINVHGALLLARACLPYLRKVLRLRSSTSHRWRACPATPITRPTVQPRLR